MKIFTTTLSALTLLAAACEPPPLRPMPPALDPASATAEEPEYQAPPNPLASAIPDAPGGDEDPHQHHHHHHHGDAAKPSEAKP